MIFHKEDASSIAKERLKLMMESDTLEYSSNDISRLKKEISSLVSRYFDISADMFEIKITLKQNEKRV
ncbi:MAG: cell division topological specificity factor MinE [Agathobacter sp.]|nr:cell division topological specificity factor MinE [Agathobacter sp.]